MWLILFLTVSVASGGVFEVGSPSKRLLSKIFCVYFVSVSLLPGVYRQYSFIFPCGISCSYLWLVRCYWCQSFHLNVQGKTWVNLTNWSLIHLLKTIYSKWKSWPNFVILIKLDLNFYATSLHNCFSYFISGN